MAITFSYEKNELLILHETSLISSWAASHSVPGPPHSHERTPLFCDDCLEGNCCHPAAITDPTDFFPGQRIFHPGSSSTSSHTWYTYRAHVWPPVSQASLYIWSPPGSCAEVSALGGREEERVTPRHFSIEVSAYSRPDLKDIKRNSLRPMFRGCSQSTSRNTWPPPNWQIGSYDTPRTLCPSNHMPSP
jgi:hypothetical protein